MKTSTRLGTKKIDEERDLKEVCSALKKGGFTIRREKLASGRGYRVKSGKCLLRHENIIFVEKSLSAAQQTSILVDSIIENNIRISTTELKGLSEGWKRLLTSSSVDSSAQTVVTEGECEAA
jgi:hypothetical protein